MSYEAARRRRKAFLRGPLLPSAFCLLTWFRNRPVTKHLGSGGRVCDEPSSSVVFAGMDQARSRFILAILCKPEWRNGRRSRLKICRGIPPCRFESDLGHHSKSLGDRMRRMIRVSLAAVVLSLTLAPFALADENPAHQPGQRAGRAESFVLTPAHNLTADEQAALRALGVTFEHNLSGGRYLVSIAGDDPSDVAAAPTVASVTPFLPSQKIYRAAYAAPAQKPGGTAPLTVPLHYHA